LGSNLTAKLAFELVDAIWLQDHRIAEIVRGTSDEPADHSSNQNGL
jgi:hypothetical protein